MHPPWGVMEVGKLHRHLAEDRQEVILSRFELPLQILALCSRELWGACKVPETINTALAEGLLF